MAILHTDNPGQREHRKITGGMLCMQRSTSPYSLEHCSVSNGALLYNLRRYALKKLSNVLCSLNRIFGYAEYRRLLGEPLLTPFPYQGNSNVLCSFSNFDLRSKISCISLTYFYLWLAEDTITRQ